MVKEKIEKSFLDTLIEDFGEEVVADKVEDIEVIPTGSLSLDVSLGVGGIPKGKISVLFGTEGTAKTSLALELAHRVLENDEGVLYLDVENMLNMDYAQTIVGDFDPQKFIVVQPDTAEKTFMLAESGVRSKKVALIVLDSIGALAPNKEMYEDEFEDVNVALVPRLMSRFLRRNAYHIRENKVAFLFINQVRDTIGSYVKVYSTPGGHALKHYATVIIAMSKGQDIKQGDEKIGTKIEFVIKKNKLANPYRASSFPLMYGKGIDEYRNMIDFGKTMGILQTGGPYIKMDDTIIGKGFNEAKANLEADKSLRDELRKRALNSVSHYEKEVSEDDLTDEE